MLRYSYNGNVAAESVAGLCGNEVFSVSVTEIPACCDLTVADLDVGWCIETVAVMEAMLLS